MAKITIDPGHGGTVQTDDFRVGPTGEREEWINLRVSLLIEQILASSGHEVLMTRTADTHVSLDDRVNMCLEFGSDCFLSVHHNACVPKDPLVNYPIVFIGGDVSKMNRNRLLADYLLAEFVDSKHIAGLIVSDKIIYKNGLGLTRGLNGKVPAVVGEFSFFSHPQEEQDLKDAKYCEQEANCYVTAIEKFLNDDKYTDLSAECDSSDFFPGELWNRFKKMAEASETSWAENLLQAEKLADKGNPTEAIKHIETTIGQYPNHAGIMQTLDLLMSCYEKVGNETLLASMAQIKAKGFASRLPL